EVLVVRASPLGLEAAGEEQAVHPVLVVVEDQLLDERGVGPEAVLALVALPGVDAARPEVEDDLRIAEVEEDASVDRGGGAIGEVEDGLEPLAELVQDVELTAR